MPQRVQPSLLPQPSSWLQQLLPQRQSWPSRRQSLAPLLIPSFKNR